MFGSRVAVAAAVVELALLWDICLNEAGSSIGSIVCEKCPGSQCDCHGLFRMHCREGGLCLFQFEGLGPHRRHRWLEVHCFCERCKRILVRTADLARFMGPQGVNCIHKQKRVHDADGETYCNLRSFSPGQASPSLGRTCEGCEARLLRPGDSNSRACEVCSVQCLVKVARLHPEWNLLAAPDTAYPPMDRPSLSSLSLVGMEPVGGEGSPNVMSDDSPPVS